MTRHKRLLLPALILALALLACSLSGTATPMPNVDLIATAAAQTVAAALSTLPSLQTPAVPETPSDTPLPENTATPEPPSTDTSAPAPTSICDQAAFISETVLDGTVFPPGAAFNKSWRLQNTGSCSWTTSYAAVFVSGDALNAPASVPFTGGVAPGQQVDVIVPMQAPASPGTYTGNWMLRNSAGVLFGLGPGNGIFLVKIVVVPPTPTETSTATITNTPSGPIVIIGTLIPFPPLHPIPSVQQVVAQVTAPAGGNGHASVSCPSGSLLTGGGFAGNTNLSVFNSSAVGNGWNVYASNTSASSQLLNAYAICVSNSSAASQQVVGQVSVPAAGIGNASIACPAGSVLTGGGFASGTGLFVYNSSASGNTWQVYARNNSASAALLNAYAVCLSGTSATSQQLYAQVSTASHAVGHAVKACPSGSLLTGGGFAGNDSLFVYNTSANGTSWETYAQNTSPSSQTLNTYAICTTFP